MKTLKISLVATVAATVAWWTHLTAKIWPEHPVLADFLMTFVLCIILQVVWTDSKTEAKREGKAERR